MVDNNTPTGGAFWSNARCMSLGRGFACRLRAIQQLDVGHWRVVANPEAALEDTQVPALALTEAWTKLDEKLADCLLVAKTRKCKAAVRNAVGLGQGDQRLGNFW